MAPRPHLPPLEPLDASESLAFNIRVLETAIGLCTLEGAKEWCGRAQRRRRVRGVREGWRHHRRRRLIYVIKVQMLILVVVVVAVAILVVMALSLGCVVEVMGMVIINITGVCAVTVGVVNTNSVVFVVADVHVLVREDVAGIGIVDVGIGIAASAI